MAVQSTTSHRRAEAQAERSRARALRYLRNQLLARRLNEEISRLPHSSSFDEYVCECGLKTCVEPVRLSREEFESVRNRHGHFVVRHGHRSRNHELVVDENDRYQLIEKSPGMPMLPAGRQDHAATEAQVPGR